MDMPGSMYPDPRGGLDQVSPILDFRYLSGCHIKLFSLAVDSSSPAKAISGVWWDVEGRYHRLIPIMKSSVELSCPMW